MAKHLINKGKTDKNEQIHMIIPIMTMTVSCVFAILVVLHTFGVNKLHISKEDSNNKFVLEQMAKAYKDVEGIAVDVDFLRITTSEDVYTELRNKCLDYIADNSDDITNVENKIEVTEDTYFDIVESNMEDKINKVYNNKFMENLLETFDIVDANFMNDESSIEKSETDNSENNNIHDANDIENKKESEKVLEAKRTVIENLINKDKSTEMFETGPIYFQDKLLLRFINSNGDMQIVGAAYTFDDNSVESIEENAEGDINIESLVPETDKLDEMSTESIKEFTNTFGENPITIKVEGKSGLEKLFKYDTVSLTSSNNAAALSSEGISEKSYLNDISSIFLNLLEIDEENMSTEFRRKALRYFTFKGYESILNNKNKLILSSDANIEVSFIEAGKSDMNSNIKDRIMIQLKVTDKDTDVLVNIVVKLNNEHRIFDIDVL